MRSGYIKHDPASQRRASGAAVHLARRRPLHTLEEVLRNARGGLVLARCRARRGEQRLDRRRLDPVAEATCASGTGLHHQLIAVACSMDHARQIRSLYEERGWRPARSTADMRDEEQEAILRDLRNGTLDAIVQVQMLGEGFDHPPLSVAAIFRPVPVAVAPTSSSSAGRCASTCSTRLGTPTTRASSSPTSG